ncbi:MAG: tRNA (adenosine(37)-N6)-dimethylallyltransferase MiaA [Gammaproteobacteria bacterium]|nr:tRNA (adenosine(37)-N6)-dimethylallyltransferase MiaA [Gammaproteobacteria bacterium]NNJ91806.1 tRNA (adenosine(37)-N6)-dimethylallyltransferase MiaA [Gammaproteobacteria bacterium]
MSEKKAVFLAGPTASGKTALAIDLVKSGRFEIISVDSALVYRGMDIGTAKPDRATLEIAPHRLIDICEPTEAYSAARFRDDARTAMDEIYASGKIPLLVGGTMLYFRALQYGLSQLPESDPVIRERLEQQLKTKGSTFLHEKLTKVDPQIVKRIHQNDPQRIMRALEVFEITGKPLSELQASSGQQVIDYELRKFVVAPTSREILHERIARRFHQMVEQGFEKEVRELMQIQGMHADLPSMRSVGYRQMLMYFDGIYDRDEMIERGIIATRQLAKRQYTWLRADSEYIWLGDNPLDEVISCL